MDKLCQGGAPTKAGEKWAVNKCKRGRKRAEGTSEGNGAQVAGDCPSQGRYVGLSRRPGSLPLPFRRRRLEELVRLNAEGLGEPLDDRDLEPLGFGGFQIADRCLPHPTSIGKFLLTPVPGLAEFANPDTKGRHDLVYSQAYLDDNTPAGIDSG